MKKIFGSQSRKPNYQPPPFEMPPKGPADYPPENPDNNPFKEFPPYEIPLDKK